MNLRIGGQEFVNVQIPLIWGHRAILQDAEGRLSVVNIGGTEPKLEILGNQPAEGVEFAPTVDGFTIFSDGKEEYDYNPIEKILVSANPALRKCQIGSDFIRIGDGPPMTGNVAWNSPVGMIITENGVGLGGGVPRSLSALMF